jgi:hypothetical protein
MKTTIQLTAALLLLSAASFADAQAPVPGVSHPEAMTDDMTAPLPEAQPAPVQAPLQAPAQASEHYVKPSPSSYAPNPAPALQVRASNARVNPDDVNSGVVIDVPVGPNEMAMGTRLKAYLQTPISTRVTAAGSRFSAAIQSDILRDGRVLLPAGTLIEGRITQIHGGRRISGASAIRLQPDELVLPDHTHLRLDAQVTDLAHFQDSHVNSEGTIVQNTHNTATAVVGGALTGTAVVAGAMMGGGVGAVVGLAVGAGAGTVLWLRQDRQQSLPEGTEIVFSLNEPLMLHPAN